MADVFDEHMKRHIEESWVYVDELVASVVAAENLGATEEELEKMLYDAVTKVAAANIETRMARCKTDAAKVVIKAMRMSCNAMEQMFVIDEGFHGTEE